MGRKKGSSGVEAYARVRSVMEWLLTGNSSTDVIRQSVLKWEISDRQAKRYISDAFKELRKATGADIKDRQALHIEARMKLLRGLKDIASPEGVNTALRIWDSTAKIEGLTIDKHEHKVKLQGKIQTTQVIIENPNKS